DANGDPVSFGIVADRDVTARSSAAGNAAARATAAADRDAAGMIANAAAPALVAQSFATAGRPTLIARSHENLWWDAEGFRTAARLDGGDIVLGVVPLSHAHGLGNALLASIHAGARLILRARFFRRQTLD